MTPQKAKRALQIVTPTLTRSARKVCRPNSEIFRVLSINISAAVGSCRKSSRFHRSKAIATFTHARISGVTRRKDRERENNVDCLVDVVESQTHYLYHTRKQSLSLTTSNSTGKIKFSGKIQCSSYALTKRAISMKCCHVFIHLAV